MPDYTPHQKKIISRYYDHKSDILLARLAEIVTDLSLAETDSARSRLWKRAEAAMQGLKIPEVMIEHILTSRKPEVLAHHLRQWQQGGK